jgi:uracil-DNA glycosylase family 4
MLMTSATLTQDKQAQYLQAMGIQAWVSRAQPLPSMVDVVPEQNNSVLEEVPVPTTSDVDVSQLGWPELQSAVSSCVACALHESRTNTVFGVGDYQAEVMVIGEAPSADEDQQGEPFVGSAGQLLNNMLLAIGYQREQVYIANILKCRPPGDRDPQPEEVSQCESYLKRQIAMVKPKVILAVGRIAAHNLMKVETPIGQMRGKLYQYGETPVVVTYHPAYLLRKPSEKAKSWDDLRFALSIIHADEHSSEQNKEKEEVQ